MNYNIKVAHTMCCIVQPRSFDSDYRNQKHRKTAVLPLLFASPNRTRARISAAEGMSLADNFLQKQQKQRKRPVLDVTAS